MSSSFKSSVNFQAGYLVVLVLVFGSIFFLIISSFIGYVVTQNQLVNFKYEQNRATDIAEAGLNYYKWYLAHYPDDVTNGTGSPGPYVHQYSDPEGDVIGEFSLDIDSNTYCGEVSSIDITSTGHTYDNPDAYSVVSAHYALPTVAEFSYITNGSVWYGPDRTITGPVHSNQGIRMDGAHNSFVRSGLTDWVCTDSFGCSPSQTKDGVFTTTSNANSSLFSFPSAPVNFTDLTIDMANMKNLAENAGGIYIPESSRTGYKIEFLGDGSFDLYEIKKKENEPRGRAYGYHLNKIKNAQFAGNYHIPNDCPLVFVEDDLWVEGVVDDKVTVAAGDLDTVGEEPTIVLNDNLTYNTEESGILLAAELDILIGFQVPDDMEINGIFIAQNGRFGRNYYDEDWLPSSWDEYVLRNSLTINGTIVSNGRVGTRWTCDGGEYCSGFANRSNNYDIDLANNPPPLAPATSDVYRFFDWRQE